MPFFASFNRHVRVSFSSILLTTSLFASVLTLAQVTLTHRMLNGYLVSEDAPLNKGKPTLFIFEQAETFEPVFKPATTTKHPDAPNFAKEMVVGIALPATNKPPKLSVSKVFVQDSTLTVRYIRMTDTTATADRLTNNPQMSQPMLLLAIPRQTVLKTRLVENGKVVQTIKKGVE
ncbi:hypothetical protein [Spirosoma areae]